MGTRITSIIVFDEQRGYQMVSSRRSSAVREVTEETEAKERRKRVLVSVESPRKRQKRSYDAFAFDDEMERTAETNALVNGLSKGTPKKSTQKNQKSEVKKGNGTPIKGIKVNGKTRRARMDLSSPHEKEVSEMSDDELISAQVTPSKSPRKVHTKTKSTSRKSSRSRIDVSPSPPSPVRTNFQSKLKAVAVSSPRTETPASTTKRKRNASKSTAEPNAINGTCKSLRTEDITSEQFERIKQKVLSKLCGRNHVPLQGHPLEVSKYLPLRQSLL